MPGEHHRADGDAVALQEHLRRERAAAVALVLKIAAAIAPVLMFLLPAAVLSSGAAQALAYVFVSSAWRPGGAEQALLLAGYSVVRAVYYWWLFGIVWFVARYFSAALLSITDADGETQMPDEHMGGPDEHV